MMSYLKDLHRAGYIIWTSLCLSLLFIGTAAQAQQPTLPALPATCDYTSEPANISLTAQNVPSGYSTVYLLVNMTSGQIVQTNATDPVFNGVARGLYYAVAAHYKGTLSNAQTGKLISEVVSSDLCLTYGPTLGLKVCAPGCDYTSAPSIVSFTANNVPGGVTTTYAMVDVATNLITQVSATASFSNVPAGDYAITSVHYTGSLTALTTGNRLYDVTTENANCLSVSNTLYVKVCNSPIAITGPLDGGTVASVNPPISGTSSPNASVTVTGGPGSTGGPCVTTADASGVWSCSSITFPAGPASVTATDGTTTAVSNFTVTPSGPLCSTIYLINGFDGSVMTMDPVTGNLTTVNVGGSPMTNGGNHGNIAIGPDPSNLSNVVVTSSKTGVGSLIYVNNVSTGLTLPVGLAGLTANPLTTGPNAGNVFGISSTKHLVRVTPTVNDLGLITGDATFTAGTISNDAFFDSNGNIYTIITTSSNTYFVYKIDIATLVATQVIQITGLPSAYNIQGIAYNSSTNSIYTVKGYSSLPFGNSGVQIYKTNMATGVSTFVGQKVTHSNTTVYDLDLGSCDVYVVAAVPPTIAITSPLNVTTTAINPPISGTTTALASVTVTTPNGQSCITTADASGNWTCTSLTFTVGAQTVSAVASNTAGLSNTATTSFTVIA
ncbi:MAG: hypothetical protein EOO39_01885, partial [Cytophagaceae bacterium]